MTTRALHYLNNQVNGLDTGGQGLEIPNLYVWLRDHITLSVSNTLYGACDPFQKNPSLIQALWDFEGDFIRLLPGNFLGKLLAPKAFNGRRRVQSSMIDFYRANSELNDDVLPFIRTRAKLLRQVGVSAEEIGRMEMSFMFVATTGSVPTIFWLLGNVLQDRDLVEAIRSELGLLVTKQDNIAELRVSAVNETSCPLLISCWQEAIRMSNQFLGTRHPVEDIVVTNEEGNSYILKEGVPVIWTARSLHASTDAWGKDATAFIGNRFVNLQGSDKKKKKSSFVSLSCVIHVSEVRLTFQILGSIWWRKTLVSWTSFRLQRDFAFHSGFIIGIQLCRLEAGSCRNRSDKIGRGCVETPE